MIIVDKNFKVPEIKASGRNTYTNPLNPQKDTPDPFIVYDSREKCYYGTHTCNDTITLYRSKHLKDIFSDCESKIVYEANKNDETYGPFWAPELHFINGKWYIYTSTTEAENVDNHKHIVVFEAVTDSPMDGFKLCAHINRELFAIDPTIYHDKKNDKLYICYSFVENGHQKLGIQQLSSPGQPIGEMTEIAHAEYPWELVAPYRGDWTINEGAYFVESPSGRLFILYSGNGAIIDDYVIGLLEFKGGNILSAESWEKYPAPIFTKGNDNFGPGHAMFFSSPDNSELWMCYHCLSHSNPEFKWIPRYCHCQRVFFDETGFLHIDKPLPKGVLYDAPSGE